MDVGNGGVLQRPAPDYDELNEVKTPLKNKISIFTPHLVLKVCMVIIYSIIVL